MPRIKPSELEAKHGEKMVEVKLRFWTNNIAKGKGKIKPKHAWAAGVVRMERNKAHGITPGKPIVFHSLLDAGAAIERALIEHDVTLHAAKKMQKYFAAGDGRTAAPSRPSRR